MTPIEIKILIYGALAFIFASGNIWIGAHFTAQHYEALAARDALARDQAVQTQQEKAIAALTAQQAATVAAEKQYDTLKASTDGLSQRLADSVRQYAALRRNYLSTTAPTPAHSDAASSGPPSTEDLAGLVGHATEACLSDAATLTGLQTWAATSSASP